MTKSLIRWQSEAGRIKFVEIIGRKVHNADVSSIDNQMWNDLKPGANTRIPLRCTVCGYHTSSPLRCLVEKATCLMCPCNPKFPLANEQGRQRVINELLRLKSDTDVSMLSEDFWKATTPGGHSKIPVRCSTCGFCTTVSIDSVIHQKSLFLCPCHPWFSWSNEESRLAFVNHMKKHQPRIDTTMFTKDWWVKNKPTAHKQITFRCTICNTFPTGIIAAIVTQNQELQCGCIDVRPGRKTERKLFAWLSNNVDSSTKREVRICKSDVDGYYYRMDFLVHGHIAIELDGAVGHFGKDWHGKDTDVFAHRDLKKEMAALDQGISVIRVYQPQVWGGKKWKMFLLKAIDECKTNPSNPRVVVPNEKPYSSGLYFDLRSHLVVSEL